MIVLVTGATGRIGAHLTRVLIRRGYAVRAFVLPGDARAAAIVHRHVEIVYGRLEDVEAVNVAAQGVDAVCHLGGALTSRGNTDEEFFEFNLRGTFNLLMAVRTYAPELQRFVYASSDAVYWKGSNAGACYLPVDEAHPQLPGSVYGATKVGAEDLCLSFGRGFGIPSTILRFGATADASELIEPQSVYARWVFLRSSIDFMTTVPNPTPDQMEALATFKSLDTGAEQLVIYADRAGNPEIRQWADARDIAEGCAHVLEKPVAIGEVFNLGGMAPHSADELVKYISVKTGLPYVTACLPVTRPAWCISSAKARGLLGYQPRRTVFDMVDEAIAKRKN